MKKIILFLIMGWVVLFAGTDFVDPIFNINSIINDPLDVKIISTTKQGNIIIQEVEFTSEVYQEKPVRIYGIIGFPEGANKLPAIFWSQSGMAPANKGMPELFASRGYVCMCITLPHSIWNPNVRFDTKNPENGNMTHYAIAQMRAITYLSTIPEVDPDRIGIGGSSYGGFFSTLIAGADPRLKCGMAFFAGGNMSLGTHIPQFTQLENLEDVDVWNKTIDPALRLRYRKIPFLWGVAANDNWFYFSSVTKTYEDSIGEKRMAIVPLWEHGFPEEVDEQLFSWFDIYLKHIRKPYNNVSSLNIQKKNNKLYAMWSFSGENKVNEAKIIVSYGKVSPWKWWVHRNHLVFPAEIKGNMITAEIPVVEPGIEMLVYGNIIDNNNVLISTVPVKVKPENYGLKKANCYSRFNLFQYKVLDDETQKNFNRMGITRYVVDKKEKRNNLNSLRVEPTNNKKTGQIYIKLHHVPEHFHILKLWVKSEKKTEIVFTVKGVEYPDQKSSIVRLLRNQDTQGTIPIFTKSVKVENSWKMVQVQCPYNNEGVEGYELIITVKDPVKYWINNIVFEPVWNK
jgi:dienelactone hydrolase